jgi:neutral ceramidase
MKTREFKAGASQTDVTPPLGSLINGDFITHYAHTIHDPLYAKALVMERGETLIAIVVVDICAMARDFVDDVKSEIEKKTGIPPGNILLSSTHTHAAGSIESLLMGAADLPYRKKLPGLIVASVIAAKEKLQPARIAAGSVDAPEHVVCRRFFMKDGYIARNPVTGGVDKVKTNPAGDESKIDRRVSKMDTEVGFLTVQDLKGKWISIIANYSMHYVGDWPNGTITADYFGVFSKQLKKEIGAGDDFVCMMTNGTSGEANIWDFLAPERYPKQPFEKSGLIGKDLAGKVAAAIHGLAWEENPTLQASYKELTVGVRKPSPDEVERAKAIVGKADFEHIKTIDEDALRKIYAREQIFLYEYPDTIKSPIQLVRIGSVRIGALAGEFFAETGLALKKESGKNYFTVTMANGYVGYVPPAHEIELGGYETWRCRTSHLEPGAEALIRKELTGFIKQ